MNKKRKSEKMSDIQWKRITMDDEETIKYYYKKEQSRNCEFTFANNILWEPHYNIRYAIIKNMLVFRTVDEVYSVSFPLGKDNVKETIEELMQHFEEEEKPFRMHLVSPEQFEVLDSIFPDQFEIEYVRDLADYIYESEKLITLSGKKLHSKRNHLNRFKAEYDGSWSYESITEENKQECFEMAEEWRKLNGCEDDPEKEKEFCVTLGALKNMEKLNLTGGLIRLDGRVIAFSIGEPVCDDTFVVHIEKAYADVRGAYPIINQQFIENEAAEYRYINREEDTGAEGLRKAKLSYYPVFMQEKGLVTLK